MFFHYLLHANFCPLEFLDKQSMSAPILKFMSLCAESSINKHGFKTASHIHQRLYHCSMYYVWFVCYRELGGSCKLILDVIKCEPPAIKVCLCVYVLLHILLHVCISLCS